MLELQCKLFLWNPKNCVATLVLDDISTATEEELAVIKSAKKEKKDTKGYLLQWNWEWPKSIVFRQKYAKSRFFKSETSLDWWFTL